MYADYNSVILLIIAIELAWVIYLLRRKTPHGN